MNTKQQIDNMLYRTALGGTNWECIARYVNDTQAGFVAKMKEAYPDLSQDDICVILLIRLDISNDRIAMIFHIQLESLRKRRYRIMQKIGVKGESSIVRFIKNMFQEAECS